MRVSLIGIAVLSLGAIGHSATIPTPPQGATATRPPRLFKDSRQSLAIARAQGRPDIVLVIATLAGKAGAAAQDAIRLGGDVRRRDDEVGYLRVRIPIDKATEFTESPNVESAAADYEDSYPGRLQPNNGEPSVATAGDPGMLQAQGQSRSPEQWPPRPGDYPLRKPYSAIKDLGAAEFVAKNPTFDGRGATIALLDGNLDLLLPEFQTAYALDGSRVPKIADYLNVTDPRDDAALNPQWVDMRAEIDASGGTATFAGKTFTVPRPGKYRIGLFDERRFNDPSNAAYIDQDVDRDGNPKGDDGLFGVLWDEKTNDVWVDTNRDLSFADQKAMTDYIKRHDVGTFGKDDPATPIRESIGFAVQTDSANKFVSINLGIYQHASGIMGHVVGNREPNGRVAGVAPGARLISMFYGVSNLHGAIEGLIRAFRHPLVDVIVFEQSVAMASIPYLLADGHHPLSIVAQRLATKYQKLMFVPGGNSPGFAIVAEDGLAPIAVSVGGYQSRDSYLANWGIAVEEQDNLHWGGMSHGPSGNGGLKPDLLAPSGQISTDVGYRKGVARKGLFQLPPGYSVDGGTSTATPMAAGAAALVVSAAKQRGLRYDAPRLKAALQGSGRYISRLAANEQGSGVVQVGPAFELLTKLQSAPMVTIVSRAPVRTPVSALFATPNEGVGLYERGGWKAGDRGERAITLTRTSGPAEPMTFAAKWVGGDGTFTSASSVTLPLNRPTTFAVTIAVKDPGAHSAMLVLEHSSIPVPVHRVLCTIVAPLPLDAANKYAISQTMSVPKPSDRSVFVDVPAGAAALSFAAASAAGPVRLSLISPEREELYVCVYPPTTAPCAIARPSAGVSEINVANNDMTFDEAVVDPAKPRSVMLTASALGVDVAATPPAGWNAADASGRVAVRLTNRLAAIPAVAASGAMGSAVHETGSIKQGEQRIYWVTVPKGAGSLSARMRAEDARADLDLYLMDCTGLAPKPAAKAYDRTSGGKSPAALEAGCATRAKAAAIGGGGEVAISDPAAGRWAIVVDAFSVPAGSTKYDYMDAFTHPTFGAIAVTDIADSHEAGAAWSVGGHAWTAKVPDPPRTLFGRIEVTGRDVTQSGFSQRSSLVSLGVAELVVGSTMQTQSMKPTEGRR